MGGIKHHLYGRLTPGKTNNYQDIKDPMDRHAAFVGQMGGSYFCSYCGGEILDADRDQYNNPVDWQMERKMSLHNKCFNKLKEEKEAELKREEANKESLEDIIKRQYGMDVTKPNS